MDFGNAFTFVTKDEGWIGKVAVGALMLFLSAFLILPIALVIGYQVAVTRNVYRGDDALPPWSNMGQFFMDGLYLLIARFVYSLPASLLLCLAVAFPIASTVAAGGNEDMMEIVGGISIGVFIVAFCLLFLFILILAFVSPALTIQYVRNEGDFSSLFRFGEVFGLARDNVTDILLVIVAAFVGNVLVQSIGGLLFWTLCGPLIINLGGAFWLQLAAGHMYGQIARGKMK